jgi:hypothetical protein
MSTSLSYTVVGLISGAPVVAADYFTETTDGVTTPVTRDLEIDYTKDDLKVSGGDLSVVDGLNAIRQDLIQSLQLFEKEWFLDLQAGLPYWDQIFEKGADTAILKRLYQDVIEARRGVKLVKELNLRIDQSTRTLYVDFVVDTDLGELTVDNLAVLKRE